MNGYIFTSPMLEGSILFQYDTMGRLVGFTIEAELTEVQHNWMMINLPISEERLKELVSKSQKAKIKLIEKDLSFDNFWNEYSHKVGNKRKAEKSWNSLSKANKTKALNWLSTYNNQVKMNGVARLYPETYINQQRWNN